MPSGRPGLDQINSFLSSLDQFLSFCFWQEIGLRSRQDAFLELWRDISISSQTRWYSSVRVIWEMEGSSVPSGDAKAIIQHFHDGMC